MTKSDLNKYKALIDFNKQIIFLLYMTKNFPYFLSLVVKNR